MNRRPVKVMAVALLVVVALTGARRSGGDGGGGGCDDNSGSSSTSGTSGGTHHDDGIDVSSGGSSSGSAGGNSSSGKSQARKEVGTSDCQADKAAGKYSGTVRISNRGSADYTYSVKIEFVDVRTGRTVGSDTLVSVTVPAGEVHQETVEDSFSTGTGAERISCKVAAVEKAISVG